MAASPELPEGVWALILGQAARQGYHQSSTSSQAFGICTAQLQLLVRAAASSRTLRRAAAAAAAELDLRLAPDAGLPPHSLSPLLAELCQGQTELQLGSPLTAAAQAAAFVAATGISSLDLRLGDGVEPAMDWLTSEHQEETVTWLPTCSCVTELEVDALMLPSALPPKLQRLILEASCVPLALPATLSAGLGGLSALQHLELHYGAGVPAHLPAHICWPHSLRTIELVFRFCTACHDLPVDLAALRKSSGCTAAVSVTANVAMMPWDPSIRLLHQLALLSTMERLWLHGAYVCDGVVQALSQIRCRLFCWTGLLDQEELLELLELPQAAHVYLHYAGGSHQYSGKLCISWAAFCRPGSFAVASGRWGQVEVLDVGPAPCVKEPWAIWVKHAGRVQGLPLHNFQQLPSGWWVWRNAAAVRLGMQAPEDGSEW